MVKEFFGQVGNIIKRSVKLGVNKLDEFLTAEENKIKEKNSNSNEDSFETQLDKAYCENIIIIAKLKGKFEAKTTELPFNMDYVASYLKSKGYFVAFDSDTFTVVQ